MPVRERFTLAGDLAFWLCRSSSPSALCIVALARPQARVTIVRKAGADIVILQDGSASMYVKDVKPDRWRRSMQFLRAFADALSWKGDRVALAIFAHTAAPQVRLTKDPNSFFFFLDHLGEHSPFRLEDTPTWDTNIETGIDWGVKLVEKDQELFGKIEEPERLRRHHGRPGVERRRRDRAGGCAPAQDSGQRRRRRDDRRRDDSRGAARRRHDAAGDDSRDSRPRRRCGRSRAPAAASISRSATSPIATSRSGLSRA